MLPILADVCVSAEGLTVVGSIVVALWAALVLVYRQQIQILQDQIDRLRWDRDQMLSRLDECEERHRARDLGGPRAE